MKAFLDDNGRLTLFAESPDEGVALRAWESDLAEQIAGAGQDHFAAVEVVCPSVLAVPVL